MERDEGGYRRYLRCWQSYLKWHVAMYHGGSQEGRRSARVFFNGMNAHLGGLQLDFEVIRWPEVDPILGGRFSEAVEFAEAEVAVDEGRAMYRPDVKILME